MKRNFDRALEAVLVHEGGYVNHVADPGGPTNKGITLAVFREHVNPQGTIDDLKAITNAEVARVYREQYWNKVRGDELPDGLDFATFDYAVNSGVSRAAKYLQAIVGAEQDGRIGPDTLKAVAGHSRIKLVQALCARRMAFLRSLRTWPTFGRGWERRVRGVEMLAIELAQQPADPPIPPPPDVEPVANDNTPPKHWLAVLIDAIISLFTRR